MVYTRVSISPRLGILPRLTATSDIACGTSAIGGTPLKEGKSKDDSTAESIVSGVPTPGRATAPGEEVGVATVYIPPDVIEGVFVFIAVDVTEGILIGNRRRGQS